VLLFTGKGGVGKTSVAAATALHAAAGGARVLLTSTDPAHSLADALDRRLGDEPSRLELPGRVRGEVWAQQLDARARLEAHWGEVRDYLVDLLAWGGVGEVAAEELLLLPGFDELFALLDLRERLSAGSHELYVVDCAPTAETLALLSLPDALRWYADRVFGPGRRLGRVVRPLTRALGADGAPVPTTHVVDAAERLHAALAGVHGWLRDPAVTSVRLVTTAERVVVAETERTATSVSILGYPLDAVIVNRLLPDEVTDPYLAGWKRSQQAVLAGVDERFAPLPVLTAPLARTEPIGVDALGTLGAQLYGEREPMAVLHAGQPVTLDHRDGSPVLRMAAPFLTREELRLHRRDAELTVQTGSVRRTVSLPAAVQRRDVVAAALVDGTLEVRFASDASDAPAEPETADEPGTVDGPEASPRVEAS
jgi:arsenite/tail-anchored protein-transporting ATPase